MCNWQLPISPSRWGNFASPVSAVCGLYQLRLCSLTLNSIGPTNATGFLAVDNQTSKIVLSFRGTVSIRNWLRNLGIGFVAFPRCSGYAVHSGFYESWCAARGLVQAALANALRTYPGYSIVVTGHSLGGAIATIAAEDLRVSGYPVSLVSETLNLHMSVSY
jgi:Lipase (class 3)